MTKFKHKGGVQNEYPHELTAECPNNCGEKKTKQEKDFDKFLKWLEKPEVVAVLKRLAKK